MKSKRIIAFIIDLFVILFFCELIKIFFNSLNLRIIAAFSAFLACILILCKDCYNGMSLGKRITNIQIFDSKTMKAASPMKCVIRNCFFLLFTFKGLIMLFSSSGMRIGDYVVHTKVKEQNVNSVKIDMPQIVKAVGLVAAIFVIMFILIYIYASNLGIIQLVFM